MTPDEIDRALDEHPEGAAEPAIPPATGEAARRRGPFTKGDRVQLTDPKGRKHTVVLEPGKQFHTHRGAVAHDELLGQPEGIVVSSTGKTPYLALRPLLADFVLAMPRGAAVVYPKDAAMIVGYADIFPGARVLEAGVGSGALACSLLRAVGERGLLVSYERRDDFAAVAQRNIETFFGGPHPAHRLYVGDLAESTETDMDRVVLDMLAPWEVLPTAAAALVAGGVLCAYVATATQLSRTCEALREHGAFAEPHAFETMLRDWHLDGLAVRPEHRMVGHTGFLVTARRLADGVTAPPRRRRPAKGAHGETDTPSADAVGPEASGQPATDAVDTPTAAPRPAGAEPLDTLAASAPAVIQAAADSDGGGTPATAE